MNNHLCIFTIFCDKHFFLCLLLIILEVLYLKSNAVFKGNNCLICINVFCANLRRLTRLGISNKTLPGFILATQYATNPLPHPIRTPLDFAVIGVIG